MFSNSRKFEIFVKLNVPLYISVFVISSSRTNTKRYALNSISSCILFFYLRSASLWKRPPEESIVFIFSRPHISVCCLFTWVHVHFRLWRRDRLTDEVSPRRRRSPNWKRRRHSQSRKGRSPSEQRCSRSRSGQRSHSRQRRERSREERHRRDAHRNERSRTRSVDRAVTDHRRKDGDQRTQRRVDVQSRSRWGV